jgi:hypothetical protein
MNRTLDDVSNAAFSAQEAWTSGNLTRFDLVEHFFDELVPETIDDDETVRELLPKIKVRQVSFVMACCACVCVWL